MKLVKNILMGGLAAMAPAFAGLAAGQQKPNMVCILMDDLGVSDLGCTGSTFYRTPNIDRLRTEGMHFTQAYIGASICSPSRVGILFGRYPARLRVTDWIPGREVPYGKVLCPQHRYFVPAGTSSIASELKKAGYVTGFIGKSHISRMGDKAHAPGAYGFDHVYENWDLNQAENAEDPKGVFALTAKAVEFMNNNLGGAPFFLFLSHYSVHNPVRFNPDVKADYEKRVDPNNPHNNAGYAAMIDDADRSVGQLLDAIRSAGIEEDTVVVFLSDNGGLLGNTSNTPYRDGKGSLYDGGVRTPLFVRWPGRVAAGSQSDEVVASVDLMPTFMQMAGVLGYLPSETRPVGPSFTLEYDPELDGVGLLPVMTQGQPLERDAIFWHYPHYYYPWAPPCGAVRMGRYKMLHFYDEDRVELYDLQADPGEQNNLATQMPDRVSAMKERFEKWKRSVNAQEVVPNPDYDPARAHIYVRK